MKHQTFTALAAATAVAFTLACSSQTGSPTSPNGLDPADSSAYADGSTLKVTAPVAVSPAGGIEIEDYESCARHQQLDSQVRPEPGAELRVRGDRRAEPRRLSFQPGRARRGWPNVPRSQPRSQPGRIVYLAGAGRLPDVHGPESGSGFVQDPESLWCLLRASPRTSFRSSDAASTSTAAGNGSGRNDPVHARGCLRSEPRRIERARAGSGSSSRPLGTTAWAIRATSSAKATAVTRTSSTS